MAPYGRVAVCGLLLNYGEAVAPPGPVNFDQVLMKRLKITGFFSADWHWRGPELLRTLRPWYDVGRLAWSSTSPKDSRTRPRPTSD